MRVVDIKNGRINKTDLITTTQAISDSYRRTILKTYDLVIPLRGKVGDVAIVDKDLAGSNLTRGLALIAIHSDLSSLFFQQLISSPTNRNRLEQSMNGSALQEIPIATLRSFKLAYPPTLAEQEAIAGALSDADALIESLEQLVAKKRQIKQGAMQELLTGKRRLPGFSGDWEVKTLAEIADVIMGQSPIGSSYNRNESGIALINGPTEFTEKYPIKIQWTTEPTKFCYKGDILLCVRGSSTGRINIADDKYCIGRGIAAIRARSNSVNSFLEFQVQSVVDRILTLTAGSTFPNIDGKSLKNIQIILPLLSEQTAIATILSDMDADIAALETKLAKARQIKQGMMQELLTGRIRLV